MDWLAIFLLDVSHSMKVNDFKNSHSWFCELGRHILVSKLRGWLLIQDLSLARRSILYTLEWSLSRRSWFSPCFAFLVSKEMVPQQQNTMRQWFSTGRAFHPLGTFDNVWRHFGWLHWGGSADGIWGVETRDTAQRSVGSRMPHMKIIRTQRSAVGG